LKGKLPSEVVDLQGETSLYGVVNDRLAQAERPEPSLFPFEPAARLDEEHPEDDEQTSDDHGVQERVAQFGAHEPERDDAQSVRAVGRVFGLAEQFKRGQRDRRALLARVLTKPAMATRTASSPIKSDPFSP
jgi:hypothetical protein